MKKLSFKILGTLLILILVACSSKNSAEEGPVVEDSPSFLDKPTNLFAVESVKGDSVYLSWTAVSKAKSYLIFKSTSISGTYTFIKTSSTNYFALTEPDPSTFFYKVQAKAGETLSEESDATKGIKADLTLLLLKKIYLMPLSPTNYVDNGDGTITHTDTGLIWQKCSAGLGVNDCFGGTAIETDWEGAKAYCSALTLGGKTWRLPEINEFITLFDYKTNIPHINKTIFPKTQNFYWSKTSVSGESNKYWFVNFNRGETYPEDENNSFSVRCVSKP